jgi:hypothetical protein
MWDEDIYEDEGLCGFVESDGGRHDAGFKGKIQPGDCVCRAIAIATGKPYREVYDALNTKAKGSRKGSRKANSSARNGVHKELIKELLTEWGWEWVALMGIGTGCKVHLRADELPEGRIICSVSRHLVAVIDGVIYDVDDCSRGGTRCVYGYWTKDLSQFRCDNGHFWYGTEEEYEEIEEKCPVCGDDLYYY